MHELHRFGIIDAEIVRHLIMVIIAIVRIIDRVHLVGHLTIHDQCLEDLSYGTFLKRLLIEDLDD